MSTPGAVRVWENSFAIYKRIWRSNLLGSFVQPLLYLLGMGIGVGALVDEGPSSSEILGGVDYFAFLAPALLATTAMIVVTQEAMWPVMDGFTWSNAYRAMAATPLRAARCGGRRQPVARHPFRPGVRWRRRRPGPVPSTRSWGLLLAVPFAVLTGMAFAGPVTAWSSTRQSGDQSFPAIMRFGIIPMFLFAGVFYPIDQLPDWLQPVAYATPLYHGVELCRGAVLGTLGIAAAALHITVLTGYWLAGFLTCRVTFERRLAT